MNPTGTVLRLARRVHRLEVVLAAAAALVVLLAGVVFVLLSPAQYQATSTLVVLPSSTAQTPDYYDTLSQGQVTLTFAQVLQLGAAQAAREAGNGAHASVVAVPDTALITASATAADAATAEKAADAVLDRSQQYVAQLHSPYELAVVRRASGTAVRTGVSRSELAVVLPLVALVCGFAVQQAVRALRRPRAAAIRDLAEEPWEFPVSPARPLPLQR